MKKHILFTLCALIQIVVVIEVSAQVGMNTTGSQPDPSAGLDINFNNKGLLPPRVALTAINSGAPITAPAVGLLVYNTANAGTPPNNVTVGYYFWNGTKWIPIIPPQGTNAGDMLYWNGTTWVIIPAGSYGQQLFYCDGVPTWGGCLPLLTTTAGTNITPGTATSGGNITSDGGTPVTARGVCWSTNANPTTTDSKTTDGSGTGNFVSNLTGLLADTLYYVKAYATNSVGTSYGNQVSFTTPSFIIGQSYGGGKIFYIDGTGQHGLIVTPYDVSGNVKWGCGGTFIGGTGTAIGTGQANTTIVLNGCSMTGIAASICDTLTLNGYTDWFLPSKDELNQIYLQKTAIGGYFGINFYWSSSEINESTTWLQYFSNGNFYDGMKTSYFCVRAIRTF